MHLSDLCACSLVRLCLTCVAPLCLWAAYEYFVLHDPEESPPTCCRDDFASELTLVMEDEGEEVSDGAAGATAHSDFAMFQINPHFAKLQEPIRIQNHDWAEHTASSYDSAKVQEASRWQQTTLQSAMALEQAPQRQELDLTKLNPSQAFVHRVITGHNARRISDGADPLRILICGTAGSGKTFLIRAIKQALGGSCLVLAPTGVAADNIGGATYHSKVPVPRSDVDRANIRLKEPSARLDRLEQDLTGVSYIIIDEMSMVGRRALGQIDELLRQATKREVLLGGMSVILVGDHGQLPPVKDHRAYDWAGCYHPSKTKLRAKMATAPRWQVRGIDAYEAFSDVFFLDKVERTTTSDDTQEQARIEYFKALQLRARDGELTDADYTYMFDNMDFRERMAEFQGTDTYKLVTTRRRRDELNSDELQACIDRQIPAISIPAIKQPNNARCAALTVEDVGLPNELLLCLGARVMVTHNISVALGLVNGTTGIVHDIICKSDGTPIAVLVRVRRATSTQDGYRGPSFLSPDEMRSLETPLDPEADAVVALTRWKVESWEDGNNFQRQQFPLMLAWAMTIHKAQGLTLAKVVIDAGDDERATGQLFVALTRVRHPDHVAFDPMPEKDRVTTIIARKRQLKDRKVHEQHLRRKASQTRVKYSEHGPPPAPPRTNATGGNPSAVPPPPPRKRPREPLSAPAPPPKTPSSLLTAAAPRRQSIGDFFKPVRMAPPSSANTAASSASPAASGAKAAAASASAAAGSRPGIDASAAYNLGQNRRFLEDHNLAAFDATRDAPRPYWLQDTLPYLRMKARVVDYWQAPSNSAKTRLATYLHYLGFAVVVDDAVQQLPNACWAVASRAAVDMYFSHLDTPGSWLTERLTDAVDASWVQLGKAVIQSRRAKPQADGKEIMRDALTIEGAQTSDTCFQGGHMVDTYVEALWSDLSDQPACNSWYRGYLSLDFTIRQIAGDVVNAALRGHVDDDLRVLISNTSTSDHTGVHGGLLH